MAKFKKGDRVIATEDGVRHYKDEKGTINEDDDTCPYVIWDSNKEDACAETNMELLTEADISIISNYQIY